MIDAGFLHLFQPFFVHGLQGLVDALAFFLEAITDDDELCLFVKPGVGFHQAFDVGQRGFLVV
ncbi:MAG: hypothetical protein BWY72_00654 [Bacteroidetes bacterium ADurb.Bin416]|nr:MAG: hypothetical protein BWY72_00654 [Bacteroidetes bacterium ADurb.Bin416]